MGADEPLYVGLMSGTSVDAIDSAVVSCGSAGLQLLATHEHTIPTPIKQQIAAISHAGDNEIERMSLAFFCETSSPPKFDSASSLL